MKYYFVAYTYEKYDSWGFRNCYIRESENDYFCTKDVTDSIVKAEKFSSVAILNYKEISRQEYEANVLI